MVNGLNNGSYLDLSMEELENRLEMEATPLGVYCEVGFCDTWNCGPKCPGTFFAT